MPHKIGVIGGGSWGTALANLLAQQGNSVLLWAREEEVVRSINEDHENHTFLREISLSENLIATDSLEQACFEKEILLSVVPSQFVRSVWKGAASFLDERTPLISASKGIETKTLELLSDVFEELIPGCLNRQLCFLSGPNFAREIAQGLPAGSTLACANLQVGKKVQQMISSPFFKLYYSDDVVGVEVGGALKNVIAIAANRRRLKPGCSLRP
jgi:glycerol-3-phosphate dehydrogenase (NAD(P)+)